MKPELRDKWAEYLESDRYTQRNGSLKKADGYCCLGVLCNAMDPARWEQRGAEAHQYWVYDGNTAALSKKMLQEADLLDTDQWKLIVMNDDQKLTFKQIAAWIRENL